MIEKRVHLFKLLRLGEEKMDYELAKKIAYTIGVILSVAVSIAYGLNFRNFWIQQLIFVSMLLIAKKICDVILKKLYSKK